MKLTVLKNGVATEVTGIYINGTIGGVTPNDPARTNRNVSVTAVYCADGTSYDGYDFQRDRTDLQLVVDFNG